MKPSYEQLARRSAYLRRKLEYKVPMRELTPQQAMIEERNAVINLMAATTDLESATENYNKALKAYNEHHNNKR